MAYYLTINIEAAGTPTSNGSSSLAGHMWYSLTDEAGNNYNYGFAPVDEAEGKDRLNGPGKVKQQKNIGDGSN